MRIIAGRYGRRPLQAPPGLDVRPTADRVREALFSALAARGAVEGARVLDLFAGTGALGLEALSRGAARATFVERHPQALAALAANVRALGAGPDAAVVRADALAWLRRPPGEAFDLAFADPPYDLPALPALPDLARPHLAPGGVFVLEHDARHDFAAHPALDWTRTYGRTVLSVFSPGARGGEEPGD